MDSSGAARAAAGTRGHYDGRWQLVLDCPETGSSRARRQVVEVILADGRLDAHSGKEGMPGAWFISGQVQAGGNLVLSGHGYPGRRGAGGKRFPIGISGRFADGTYRGDGSFGSRSCAITLTR